MVTTGKILNKRREEGCFAYTAERKYYHIHDVFIKRSLRPSEWQVSPFEGTIHVPRQGGERLRNEAAALQYVNQHTSIPAPKFICCFEDNEAVFLLTEYVEGVGMDSLSQDQKQVVTQELERHLQTMHSLRSSRLGGPSGLIVPPYRVTHKSFRDDWNLKPSDSEDFVFCHNDLSQPMLLSILNRLRLTPLLTGSTRDFIRSILIRRSTNDPDHPLLLATRKTTRCGCWSSYRLSP